MSREQGKEAPALKSNGDKWNGHGARSNSNPNGLLFGQEPVILRRYINQTLTGQNGNLLKLITLFIETEANGKFNVSKAWVLEETGMAQNKYYEARQDLEDIGWISCYEDCIEINYDFMYEEAFKKKEDRIDILKRRRKR